MDDQSWLGINPGELTGFAVGSADSGSGGVQSGVAGAVSTAASGHPPIWSPENPLFWFGLLLLAAAGAIHLSTSFSAGPAKGSAEI